jgi:hypothetical protein
MRRRVLRERATVALRFKFAPDVCRHANILKQHAGGLPRERPSRQGRMSAVLVAFVDAICSQQQTMDLTE